MSQVCSHCPNAQPFLNIEVHVTLSVAPSKSFERFFKTTDSQT